ncbi:hypothetical protein M405DRAFT_882006 [Rhizopogon salebrosus TDB-379]|nr:hypothetical protein M405DRAFT_882006 [Rhizopogon salebrosus TDB-379]
MFLKVQHVTTPPTSRYLLKSLLRSDTHKDSCINGDISSSPTETLATTSGIQLSSCPIHEEISSEHPFDFIFLGLHNHSRNAVADKEYQPLSRVADPINAIEPGCTTSQGTSHEYDGVRVVRERYDDWAWYPVDLDSEEKEGLPRLLGHHLSKAPNHVDGSPHVEGTAELGYWKDGDEEYIPGPWHKPKDYGVIGDRCCARNQSFDGLKSLCRKLLRSFSELVKVKQFIDGSAHVEGTAELGDWKDGDEEYIPDPGHPPKDYGIIGNPFRKQRESLLQKILKSLCRKPLRSLSANAEQKVAKSPVVQPASCECNNIGLQTRYLGDAIAKSTSTQHGNATYMVDVNVRYTYRECKAVVRMAENVLHGRR